MKTNRLTLIVMAIAVFVTMMACSILSFAQPTATPSPTDTPQPTYTPQPTFTPQPTYTPYPTATPLPPTEVPPTEVPPTPTFSGTVMVNGVDPVKILKASGFTYAGGADYGGCLSSCAVYDDTSLGLSVNVYDDGSMVFSIDFGGGFDSSAQAAVIMALLNSIYGHDMMVWVDNNNGAVLGGSEQIGTVGNFGVFMKFYNGNLLVISIAPAS